MTALQCNELSIAIGGLAHETFQPQVRTVADMWRSLVSRPGCIDATDPPCYFPPTFDFNMPTIPVLGPAGVDPGESSARNPLPTLLQTPSGLALLEIQGTVHVPPVIHDESGDIAMDGAEHGPMSTPVGNLVFPQHDPAAAQDDTKWMKKVYLYVGNNQRLTGQVQKLPKAIAVLKRDEAWRGPLAHHGDR